MLYRVRGAILIGILLTSIISWPRSTPVTYFPHTTTGDALFNYFKQVVTFHKLEKVGNAIDVSRLRRLKCNALDSVFMSSTITEVGRCGTHSSHSSMLISLVLLISLAFNDY
jgi:xanthine/uracil/vitamin C permease (AzgA family)